MISLAVDFEMINRVLPVTFDDGLTLAVDFALDPATMGVYFGGTFAEAQTAYRKIPGAWVNVTDAAGLKAEMRNMNLKAGN